MEHVVGGDPRNYSLLWQKKLISKIRNYGHSQEINFKN